METGEDYNTSHNRVSAVRRDIVNVNDRVNEVNNKVEALKQGLSPVPDRMGDMDNQLTTRARQLQELEERNKVHSARLKVLQKEMQYVKLENDMLIGQMQTKADKGDKDRSYPMDGYTRRPDGGQYEAQESPRAPLVQQDNHRAYNGRDVVAPSQQPTSPRKAEVGYPPPRYDTKGYGKGETFEEMQRRKRKEIYSTFDSTAINPQNWEATPKHSKYPWFDHETHPYPGGFLFLRFDDSGYDVANIAIKGQESICRHAGGYLMGMARKQRIFVYEMAPSKQQNWKVSHHSQQQRTDVVTTENAIAAFWFTKKEAAEQFFENSHHNRFREPCFPTPDGYEAFFVPMQSTPPMRPYYTFLFIEFLDARHYKTENMTQFEAEVRNDMLRIIPGCLPMVVSSLSGRVVFKPGMLISPYSKLYICQFEAQKDAQEIWRLGMIQALRQKWSLTGSINAFSFTIETAF